RLLAQRFAPPARVLESDRPAAYRRLHEAGGGVPPPRSGLLVRPRRRRGDDRGVARGSRTQPGTRLDPRGTGNSRTRGVQYVQLAPRRDARPRRVRHPGGGPSSLENLFRLYLCQALTSMLVSRETGTQTWR